MEIKINTTLKFTGGDCVSHYDASFDGYNPTLDEFVNWVISNHMEWGEIRGKKKYVEYEHGAIVKLCRDYNEIKDKRIILTRMDGGWSLMDYTIKFE